MNEIRGEGGRGLGQVSSSGVLYGHLDRQVDSGG